MIDRHELLATLKPVVTQLEESIRERALATPEVAAHLEQEHHKAVVAERTAMSLEEWRDGEITQAAVAWVLACVFVRFLEDNGLIDQALISGPVGRRAAALGHREEHFRLHPEHSDREYLEACFRAVAAFPAVAPLFDELHNPLWRLAPTADGARALRETFTAIDPNSGQLVHDFMDPGLNTRFLGDLYQDLSETAKKRFALLQTPDFIERFILDRTLIPAINEFGLDEVRIIDPTCGSGHFLIGAFERLFARWVQQEPGTSATVLAQRCLDHIAGVDLNPYATAIARFRLLIAAVSACNIHRLSEAPAFALHLATGDSLLHGPLPSDGATMLFDANRLNQNIQHVFETEDETELRQILGQGYHAVVGNPPYIAAQDAALRDAYRTRYASCHGKYVLTVPFMERFFELAKVQDASGHNLAGFVGKITGNNFMKREFGAPLVERFLPSVDVKTVIDAAGAYLPGHGTPTILLFGRSRAPVSATLRVVDGIRGEPGQPDNPANGLVWSGIEEVVDRPGHENRFVRSSDIERSVLFTHPMTLGIGRALRKQLEVTGNTLGTLGATAGVMAFTGEDEVFTGLADARGRDLPIRAFGVGDSVRDWAVAPIAAVFPYDENFDPLQGAEAKPVTRALWPWRTGLAQRLVFGKNQAMRGYEWYEWTWRVTDRYARPPSISWAFVATHNHFALDRHGTVFNRTAPVIKLPASLSDDRCMALLGLLNSSAAGFWIKQVAQNRGSTVDALGARQRTVPWEDFYELSGKRVEEFPLPDDVHCRLPLLLDQLANERASLLTVASMSAADGGLNGYLADARRRDEEITLRLISLQEELDWQVLAAYRVVPGDLPVLGEGAPPIALGHRAFEFVLARQAAAGAEDITWFERHGSKPVIELPDSWPSEYRNVVERRIELIESDPDVGLIERAEHKRRWNRPSWNERGRTALAAVVLDALEDPQVWADLRLRSVAELTDHLRRTPIMVEALQLLADQKDADLATVAQRLVLDNATPHLAAQRLTEKGMRKREVWERVWQQQRAEDRLEDSGPVPQPPRYVQADYRSPSSWKNRGKLDVPRERFVLIPHAERGADPSPVVGWAGWNECDLSRALAGRIMELREQEAADADRVTPLLAGVLELLPWIHQWHPDSDPLYGGPPGQYFEGWLDGQLAELTTTRDNLRAWRPLPPTRGRKAKAGAA